MCMCVCISESLCYTPETNNTINQLYFSKINSAINKEATMNSTEDHLHVPGRVPVAFRMFLISFKSSRQLCPMDLIHPIFKGRG